MRDLTVVVVSFNTVSLLRDCLASLRAWAGATIGDVIVVDNASSDGSPEMVAEEFPEVRLLRQSANIGFGAANNLGVAASGTRYVMLLNSDALLLEDTGAALVRYMEGHADVSCVGPLVLLPDGRPQPRVYGNQPSLWRIAMQSLAFGAVFKRVRWLEGIDGGERSEQADRVGWISGVCMVMRRTDFLDVGGFDPRLFMYCEDVELCARLSRRVGAVVRLNGFGVRHFGGASSPGIAAQVRSAVWAQRNLLIVVQDRSGRPAVAVAKSLLWIGLLLRMGLGLLTIPRRGVIRNLLLRTSAARLRALLGSRI